MSGTDNIGLLAGCMEGNSIIYNVTVSGPVYAEGDAGGIAGEITGGSSRAVIENCIADGVTVNSEGVQGFAGGIGGNVQKADPVSYTHLAELNGKELTFTCISEEYGGGMLYLADQTVSLEMFGGYGGTEYGDSNVFRYFRDGFQNGFSIKTGILGTEITGTSGTAYACSLSREEYDQYRERVTGADFLLRDSENGQVLGVSADGSYSWQDAPATDYGIRPAIVLEIPDTGQPDRIHWNTGDVQAREIDGETYMFRCIDQNYSDGAANHRQAALFLAETVIPANYGSDYELEETDDGSHQYIFTPGPVVSFGDSNDYKYSRIRQWLGESEENFFNTEPIRIGVDYAFMGSTAEKEYSGFDSNDIRACYIGDQQLTERVFILSVDEAME